MLFYTTLLFACGSDTSLATGGSVPDGSEGGTADGGTGSAGDTATPFTRNSRISDVTADPIFAGYGRLLFPVQQGYWSGETLGTLRLTYYNNIDADKTVEIANYLHRQASAGQTVFYDIYSEREKAANPQKLDTGLFFFRGKAGARFAVCNAGGAFAYVGAMHDSFPHALELSKKGYNAFALIYRPGAQTACEDLARAISFIFAHADELGVDTSCYSLWGGSAGGRMAAWVSGYGVAAFDGDNVAKAGTAVIQYTGLSDYSHNDVPTYACVGDRDGIASWRTMKARLDGMASLGIATEFHVYEGLGHGFGLGTGTVAEGWIDDAVRFWERQMPGGEAVMSGTVDLWCSGHIPATTKNVNNSDGPDFMPNMEVFTVGDGVKPKGAVLICPGGAFAFRSVQNEGYDVAHMLTQLGYQCFVVNYRIRPYTMQESALDLQRAIRYVRAHAADYRIAPQNIALVGFSAGGILNGEVLLNWRGLKNASILDSSYQPDALDEVPVSACAVGMIYSFYGRLVCR